MPGLKGRGWTWFDRSGSPHHSRDRGPRPWLVLGSVATHDGDHTTDCTDDTNDCMMVIILTTGPSLHWGQADMCMYYGWFWLAPQMLFTSSLWLIIATLAAVGDATSSWRGMPCHSTVQSMHILVTATSSHSTRYEGTLHCPIASIGRPGMLFASHRRAAVGAS